MYDEMIAHAQYWLRGYGLTLKTVQKEKCVNFYKRLHIH